MAIKPWYNVITPREDLVAGKPLDASEFAVHLDHVRLGTAPMDYTDPERFFHRTYLTQTLLDMAAQTIRRFSGITTETSPVFNLTTQFGGGKTHSLTLLYHLAQSGNKAKKFQGVNRILTKAEVDEIKTAKVAIFVGTEFSSVNGRGEEGEPNRKTPWGELAFQLGGENAFEQFAELDKSFIPPGGDDLGKLFDKNQPYLLLYDELLNYVSKHRNYHNLSAQFYNFLQTLTEFVRSRNNIVLAVSIPASELEMNTEDQADYDRFKKMLDRLGKAMFMSAEKETSEIIRRRLFEWHGMHDEARKTISDYIQWIDDHRAHLSFNPETARQQFEASYPFHPAVLTLFERKWQALPRFQQTRGVLRLLALWVAKAYNDGYKKLTKDALITLGTAPLEDANFRAAVFEQLGENRLEAAVTTDIAGKDDSHAIRLDNEAIDAIKKSRLHKKCATTIFFESNGGQTAQGLATLPEIKLSVGDPDLDIGLVDGAIQSLLDGCYYLTAVNNKYKYSIHENLIKRYSDRRASIQPPAVNELVEAEIRKVFDKGSGFEKVMFPERNNQVTDRSVLSLVVLHPSKRMADPETKTFMEDVVNNYGSSARVYKSGLIFCIADDGQPIKEEAKKFLAWETIYDEAHELKLDDDQRKQVKMNMDRAKKDLAENVWRAYKNLVLLNKTNTLHAKDLGLIHSSQARTITELYLTRLESEGEVSSEINPNFLARNWPPAFTAWSTKNVRDAFYQTPQFPRLTNPDSIKATISRGVENGILAYVGKQGTKYEPFFFEKSLFVGDVEISDDMFILTAEEARKNIEPRKLATIKIVPPSITIEPENTYSFIVKGYDQHSDEINIDKVDWKTSYGTITDAGVLTIEETEGVYKVTASSNGISATATVTVQKKDETKPPTPETPTPTPFAGKTKINWSGQVDTKKWNVFYTKVLAKFASNPNLKITVKFEVEDDASNAEQKKEETKTALREMGLDEYIG
ncbi:MAG: ATP-binding protein [Bacteroidetes bacterium]|nr:ATP-binding protein [Bacteroidota bacterium]